MSRPFSSRSSKELHRRAVLAGSFAFVTLAALDPARAEPEDMENAIRAFTGNTTPQTGRVTLDVAPLVENGNAVSVEIRVDHPMQAGNFVREIALFNEKNPQADVAVFRLSSRSGRAQVITRMRLATSQVIVAVARLSDGTCWIDKREVIVTIAACTEE